MKTKLMLSTAIAATIATTAQAGFYVGGGLGYTKFTGKEKAVKSGYEPLVAPFNGTQKSNLNASGSKFFALTGYDHEFVNKFFVGSELQLGFYDASKKKSQLTRSGMGKRKIQAKDFFNLHGRFGYKVAEKTKLFVKAGLESAKFIYKTSDAYAVEGNDKIVTAKKTKRKVGFSYGAGVEQGVGEKIALRLEVAHVNYGTLKTSTTTPLVDDDMTKHSIKMKSTTASAAIIYKI